MTTQKYHNPHPAENNEKAQPPLIRRVLPSERVADTFRRTTCECCQDPVITLGEAIRLERAEGGYTIIHICATSTSSGALGALKAHAEAAEREERRQMRRAA